MMTAAAQPSLLPEVQMDLFAGEAKVYERFKLFHETNPSVYLLFEKFARELIEKGHKRVGARMIIERIRWECAVSSAKDADGFKINNMFIAHYARLFIRNHPQYREFFEFREIRTL